MAVYITTNDTGRQYQDDAAPRQLGFPRQDADPRGRKPVINEATAADRKVSFPLSDGSDGEHKDKAPDFYDDQSDAERPDADEADEPLHEGSSRSPPWLQRAPYELDNKFSGCNPHAARKGRPTRRMRADTHNGEVQRLAVRNPDEASSESELEEETLRDSAGNIEMLRDAADFGVPLAEAPLSMVHQRPTSAR